MTGSNEPRICENVKAGVLKVTKLDFDFFVNFYFVKYLTDREKSTFFTESLFFDQLKKIFDENMDFGKILGIFPKFGKTFK